LVMLSLVSRTASKRVACTTKSYCRTLNTAPSAFPPLPEESEWRTIFNPSSPGARERISIRNPKTADALAESFLSWTNVKQPRVVIEAFPGPGALTRSLLKLPKDKLQKLIVLEDNKLYLEHLRPLEEIDSRLKVLPFNGHSWDTYSLLEEQGLLEDIPTVPWGSGVHPKLHFISHIPLSVMGEQLVNQFFRCIPDQTWLFRYGRVPMNLLMGEWVWQRLSATALDPARCKLSVIAQSTADLSLSVPSSQLLPYDMHFHPTIPKFYHFTAARKSENRKLGHPMQAINILPLEDTVISKAMLDKWDYCLRRLFVLKSQALRTAIGSLAPGAQSLLKTLTDKDLPASERVDTKKPVRNLTIEDWTLLIKAFDNWPFAPEDLMIHDSYNPQNRNSPPA